MSEAKGGSESFREISKKEGIANISELIIQQISCQHIDFLSREIKETDLCYQNNSG